jgi:hypothetical protein
VYILRWGKPIQMCRFQSLQVALESFVFADLLPHLLFVVLHIAHMAHYILSQLPVLHLDFKLPHHLLLAGGLHPLPGQALPIVPLGLGAQTGIDGAQRLE